MKKILVIIILVIILVCINWINNVKAQITPDDYRAYQNKQAEISDQSKDSLVSTINTRAPVYHTPPIFDTIETISNTDNDMREVSEIVEDQDFSEQDSDGQLVLPRGDRLKRFGSRLFTQPQIGDINQSLIPEDYILGPGDNIIISLWGRVQQEWNLTVDRQGKVFIPKVGEITAVGATIDEFEARLDAALAKVYSGFEKRVALGKIRTIKVFVYGEVKSPGGYAVSALSTLFSALYMAGGPNENGSFRSIRLMRGQEARDIDLYDFLIAGDKTCDLPLMSGDVIFVPLAGEQAAVRGEVKRPAIYELRGGEKVSDLIELGGGPTADAYMGRLMLDRISPYDAREVIDLNFSGENPDDPLLADGDDLSIFSIYQMRQNLVWVSGMVKHPGTFEREEGMTISALIDKGQLLPTRVYRERADLYRHHADGRVEIMAVNLDRILNGDPATDLILADLDSLHIYCTDDITPPEYVYVDGMVRRPGQYNLYDNMTVADLVFLAGSLNENAYHLEAELARIDSLGNTDLIKISLTDEMNQKLFPLQENDRLFVRKIPGYELHRMVTIEGEVLFPGRYSLARSDESLWDLIQRAGGFTHKAFAKGMVFKRRRIVQDLERQDIEQILISSLPLQADSQGNIRPVTTVMPDANRVDRIIVNMHQLLSSGGTEGDFQLQAGDYIYVPEVPTGVTVMGEVCANGTINYEQDRSVKYYLQQAGGFTRRADKSQTRLVKADGRIFAEGNAQGKKVDLGDIIIVPAEIKKEKDWMKIVTAGVSIVTGLATSIFIIDRL